MEFVFSFIQYFIILVILAVIAFGGILLGRSLRRKKDAKIAALAGNETKE